MNILNKSSFLFIILFIWLVQSKIIADKIRVTSFNRRSSFSYISKFAMEVGEGNYQIKVKLKERIPKSRKPPKSIPIMFEIHLDDD